MKAGGRREASRVSKCSRRLCHDQLRLREAEVLEVLRGQRGETVGGAERFWKLWSRGEISYLTNLWSNFSSINHRCYVHLPL